MAKPYNVTAVLAYAAGAVGKPYRWAASGPNAYDCSGLTMRAMAAGGYRMPHNAEAQYLQTARFRMKATDSPPAGCLLFFGTAGVFTHCGLSIGGGTGIFAPHTGTNVQRQSIAAVRSAFPSYQVTNPLGVTESTDLTPGEKVYSALGSGGKPIPPGLGIFLAALRWQESGSQHGNYREPNGQGAYQIIPSTWQALAARYNIGGPYPSASSAPPAVQDEVAARRVTEIYYGPGEKSWRITARVWNGGTPNVVPNPALGPGATTNTYASEVLAKMAKINPAQLTGAAGNAAAQQAAADAALNVNPDCQHSISIDLKITSANICMDKPLALIAITGGGLLFLGAIGIVFASAKGNKLVAAAANVVPAGRVANIARAATPSARAARDEKRAGEQAKRLAPVRAEQRRDAAARQRADTLAAAEARRDRAARASNRRANAAARQRREHREESHLATQSRRDSAAARGARTRSLPGEGHTTARRRRTPAPALPDEPPF